MKKILMTGMLFMIMIWMLGCAFRGHRCTMAGCGRAALLGSSHCRLHQDTWLALEPVTEPGGTAEASDEAAGGVSMALAGERRP